ncbi:MAG TPA: hypothetical protein VIV60_25405 [Polyangiaceae bacterium]
MLVVLDHDQRRTRYRIRYLQALTNGFTGCIRPSVAAATFGEAIDRFTGQLLDKQIEVVNEQAARK